jgi:hypothetical protein
MLPTELVYWNAHLRRTLACYDTSLLRQVAGNLCRPRNQWPAEELIERSLQAFDNPAVLDRRLSELDPASRMALALIGHSRQPRWPVGQLVEMLVTLGHADGLEPIRNLLEAGLLHPELPLPEVDEPAGRGKKAAPRVKTFEQWLSATAEVGPTVFAHPALTARALGADVEWPGCPDAVSVDNAPVQEADGLEWLLRLAVLWQQTASGPLRRTQQRDFFKRDLERLRGDPLLVSPPADAVGDIPDPGLFVVALALAHGLIIEQDGEVRIAGVFPEVWRQGTWHAVASLWSALPHMEGWNPAQGWQPTALGGNPYPGVNLLALLLLARLPANAWAAPDAIEAWIRHRHPAWPNRTSETSIGVAAFLRGVAFPLRLVQAAKEADGAWMLRLSALGRWVLGVGPLPPPLPTFPQTLLVQPNLEILAYRQGLTPDLIIALTRLAAWKTLGAACTLQLQPETVYSALEAGATFETIVQTLERHGQKTTPSAVIDALRTWSDKRERLTVYPAGALLEFATPADLQEALTRGLPAVRLTERLAVVANEDNIDYRHFRMIGTRDYAAPPERCVDVEEDGVTLSVDVAKADLLLEPELAQFAEPVPRPSANGRRLYRLTPATVGAGRRNGLALPALESWFGQRCGQPVSPAARLLLTAGETAPPQLAHHLVLHVAAADIADGLCQWPATRALIHQRLGPTALSVEESSVPRLLEELNALGITAASPPPAQS